MQPASATWCGALETTAHYRVYRQSGQMQPIGSLTFTCVYYAHIGILADVRLKLAKQ